MNLFDDIELALAKLRSGEKAICPSCKKGELKAVGDPIKTHFFICDTCKQKIKIN